MQVPRTVYFGLLVTGVGEERFLGRLFRALAAPGPEGSLCVFEVVRRIPQLSPLSAPARKIKMVGRGQTIATRDEEIGLAARRYIQRSESKFVILVDDLEHARRDIVKDVFDRYRKALNCILGEDHWRASVHFFVNMIEAYYFADAQAINAVLDLSLTDTVTDVEQIRHPKNDLKKLFSGFDEIEHGDRIVRKLNLERVLEQPDRCGALRSLVAWCNRAAGRPPTERFRLSDGVQLEITAAQATGLPPVID